MACRWVSNFWCIHGKHQAAVPGWTTCRSGQPSGPSDQSKTLDTPFAAAPLLQQHTQKFISGKFGDKLRHAHEHAISSPDCKHVDIHSQRSVNCACSTQDTNLSYSQSCITLNRPASTQCDDVLSKATGVVMPLATCVQCKMHQAQNGKDLPHIKHVHDGLESVSSIA